MQLRYRYRLYPTARQRAALGRAFGSARVVYNDALRAREEAKAQGQPYISDADMSKQLTAAKKRPERAWLTEVSAVVLQQALADLNSAYRNYFDSQRERRPGPRMASPRYKSKKDAQQSIRFTRNACFRVTNARRLRLPKVGDIPVRWSRELPSEPSSVTIIKDPSDRYFASFVVEVESDHLAPVGAEVGIDLGLETFAVLSDGSRIESPRFLRRAERRLKKAQRAQSRKQRGSRNRAKARLRFAKAHSRVRDARMDWLHKRSTDVVRENQAVYVEDLCVRGLARSRLAKSVNDAGWGLFLRLLEQKTARYGRHLGRVDRFFPSSQRCSACGVVDGPKPLAVRSWTCASCGNGHDRDLNAAINILAAGRAERLNACGVRVSPELLTVPHREAGTHEPTPSSW